MLFDFLGRVGKFFLAACIFYGISSGSYAGYKQNRLVVWVNLEGNSDDLNVDEVISKFIKSKRIDSECGVRWEDWGSTLYMKKRPDGITNELIQKVFVDGDKPSLRRLNKSLRSFRDSEIDTKDGLDGVMVYSNKNGPHLMNFVAGRKNVKTYPLSSDNSSPTVHDIEEAFCILLPPTTRAP